MEKINEIKQAETMLCMSECVWEQNFQRHTDTANVFYSEMMTQNIHRY